MIHELQGWQEPLLIYHPFDERFPTPPRPTVLQDRTQRWMTREQQRYTSAKIPTVIGYCTLALASLHLKGKPLAADRMWDRAQALPGYRPAIANRISRDWVRQFMEYEEFPSAWRILHDVVQIMPVEPLRPQGDTAYLAHELAAANTDTEGLAPIFRQEAATIWAHAIAAGEEVNLDLFFECGGQLLRPPAVQQVKLPE